MDNCNDENQQKFEAFKLVLPHINDLLVSDVGVALADREKILLYKPGKTLRLQLAAGDAVKAGGAVAQAMAEKRRIVMTVDKSLWGTTCIAVAIPILNSRQEVIGGVALHEPIARQEKLMEMAKRLAEDMGVLASTSEELSAQAQEISAVSQNLSHSMQASQARVKETEEVLRLIDTISKQTNLLGLNAAIEAARAGETGRGFGVVADEIRKLATESGESVRRIDGIIKTVQRDSAESNERMEQIGGTISQVSEAIQHIAVTVQNINNLALALEVMAKELSRDQK